MIKSRKQWVSCQKDCIRDEPVSTTARWYQSKSVHSKNYYRKVGLPSRLSKNWMSPKSFQSVVRIKPIHSWYELVYGNLMVCKYFIWKWAAGFMDESCYLLWYSIRTNVQEILERTGAAIHPDTLMCMSAPEFLEYLSLINVTIFLPRYRSVIVAMKPRTVLSIFWVWEINIF